MLKIIVQVLSKSVADAFQYYGDPTTAETEKFVRCVDKFFDCLNVRSISEWATKRKPERKPYSSCEDERFKVQKIAHYVNFCHCFVYSTVVVERRIS